MNATATLSQLTAPAGVTLLDDPDETVLATITPPTQEPVEEEIETETELVGEGAPEAEGDAEGDERRGGARSRPPTSPEALLLRTRRLARRRPRQPGRALRRHAAQRRLPGRRRADRALGPAQAEEEVRGRAGRGPHRARRPARRRAQAADVHERGRPLRRPCARLLQARPRPPAGDPRRDRPAVRRHPRAAGRRARGPQRPQVAQARAGRGGLPPRAHRAWGGPTPPIRRSSRRTCSGSWRRSADEVRELVERARDEAERVVLGGDT